MTLSFLTAPVLVSTLSMPKNFCRALSTAGSTAAHVAEEHRHMAMDKPANSAPLRFMMTSFGIIYGCARQQEMLGAGRTALANSCAATRAPRAHLERIAGIAPWRDDPPS